MIYFLTVSFSFCQGASQLSDDILAREARLRVDFRRLENDYKNVGSDAEMKKVVDQLQKQLKEVQEQLSKIQAPNMHADERCGAR